MNKRLNRRINKTINAAMAIHTLVRDGGLIGLMKRVIANESAEQLRANILHHLANEAQPEFNAVRIVRTPADSRSRHAAFFC